MPRWRSRAIALTLVLFGCGGSEETVAPSPPPTAVPAPPTTAPASTTIQPTAPPTSPTVQPVAVAAPAAVASPLQRRDALPEGVTAQFAYASFAYPCDLNFLYSPPKQSTTTAEPGSDLWVCFPAGAVMEVTADGNPDVSLVPTDYKAETWRVLVSLFDPPGTYTVTVTDAGTMTSLYVTAQKPDRPRLKMLDLAECPPREFGDSVKCRRGTTFRADVLSPVPNGVVTVDMYYRDGSTMLYATTLAPVMTDGQGRGSLEIASGADDPPGRYGLRPRGGGSDDFRVT